MQLRRSLKPLILAVALSPLSPALAGDRDWPQWRGTNRDGHAAPQKLLQSWPEGGPKMKWEFREAGVGYSAFAIRDGLLYTLGAREDGCYVICVDTAKGEQRWQTKISRPGASEDYAFGWGGGPRSTPTLDGEFVYALSDVGVLACLKADKGESVWSVDFVDKYKSSIPKWGFAESVLIDGDRVVATPGGESFLVGFNKTSGEQTFASKGHAEQAQYVSIMKQTIGETAFYVTASKAGIVAFDAKSGELLFSDNSTGNPTAVIPTPITHGDLLYHTSDYGAGNALLKLAPGAADKPEEAGKVKVEKLYAIKEKSMQNHHGGVVLVDGTIFGASKANGGVWMAQDLQSGKTLWEERIRPNRSGSIAFADGRLYCYNDEDATVMLVEPNKTEFKKVGQLKLPATTKIDRGSGAIWAHPVIADGTLFLRDQELIFAFDITRTE
jgi:outer membrane protein assembly factor BamB